jgi:hypothetical protein
VWLQFRGIVEGKSVEERSEELEFICFRQWMWGIGSLGEITVKGIGTQLPACVLQHFDSKVFYIQNLNENGFCSQ